MEERLRQRIEVAIKALTALDETLAMPVDEVVRDAAIQRFEFCVEAVWKILQLHLREKEGLELGSPKQVFRACFQVGLLGEEKTSVALKMVDDRNLTVHTYNEALAEAIYNRLLSYSHLMHQLVQEVNGPIKNT